MFRSIHPKAIVATIILSFALGLTATADEPAKARQKEVRATIKVAAVQVSGYDKGDLPKDDYDPTVQILPYIDRAGKDDVDLIVFPEYVLGHIKVPGPATKKIAAAAAANRLYVIVGCWEQFSDGTYANTALIFDRDGAITGKYHKTHAAIDHYEGSPAWANPPAGKSKEWFLKNDPEWTMEKGDGLPVFDLDFGKVGVMTCYDGWFPEPARVLSLRGAELIVWINGRGGSVEDFIVKSTMFRSHVAMITANQAYGSGTMIGNWPARIIARCPDKTEAYITATIDLARIRRARETSRNFRQRRPDLYSELVKPQDERHATKGK